MISRNGEKKTSIARRLAVSLLHNFKASKSRGRRAATEYNVFGGFWRTESIEKALWVVVINAVAHLLTWATVCHNKAVGKKTFTFIRSRSRIPVFRPVFY